ncbi:GAF and ANTAR domain-containing protein [Pseudonocardia halophobica]|uniref:Transcriptional regulator n=1 Tax=Pseudonocardia halophobica TaxID=29401 RepID=A0A9W6P0D0_9PSEU|nr:GAF and ANTAR domain-containing protein [Pseudonocardia halophobica]GLL15493.1 transcriptional regulator [Pseudonocardia halophobica]
MAAERNEELARLFVGIARHLHAEDDPAGAREQITLAAVATVPGCAHAAISLVRRNGTITTVAATDELPAQVDAVQYETGQGPCLEALEHDRLYRSDDLEAETRWPDFARPAAERTGVRSMLSYRLYLDDEVHGALNLYSRTPRAFDDHAVAVGAILAGHATLALSHSRDRQQRRNLSEALDSNRDIGVAIGILMASHGITRDRAFDVLRDTSQWLNRKLREVAEEVTHTGRLPSAPERSTPR